MISSTTLKILLDAGQSNEWLTAITAAFDSDMEHACNLLRNSVTLSDAGSVTPAALRMRKMREIKALSKVEGAVTERNTVTSPSVTSYNNNKEESGIEEESKKELVVTREARKVKYSDYFEKTFWVEFPTDQGMSKKEAWAAWQKLDEADRVAAVAAIPAFKKWVAEQGPNYRTVHACRYLSQRRFDGFHVEPELMLHKGVHIMAGTDEWDEWEAFYLTTKGKKPSRDFKGGWTFPTLHPLSRVPQHE